MNKDMLEAYGWILSGSQRVTLIKLLDRPKTPKMLTKESNLHFSNVSEGLKGFTEKGIAICLNPENHLGRLYTLTDKGKKVREQISEQS